MATRLEFICDIPVLIGPPGIQVKRVLAEIPRFKLQYYVHDLVLGKFITHVNMRMWEVLVGTQWEPTNVPTMEDPGFFLS